MEKFNLFEEFKKVCHQRVFNGLNVEKWLRDGAIPKNRQRHVECIIKTRKEFYQSGRSCLLESGS